MIDLQQLYFSLPYPLKVCAASLQGFWLRRWRYGPESDRVIREARERETWDTDAMKSWQSDRLMWVLQRAAAQVPYYREYWDASRGSESDCDPSCLSTWPILHKETLRNNPDALVADCCEHVRTVDFTTSGSSGTPLRLKACKKDLRAWYGLAEARWRQWYGVNHLDRWAMLGGQLVARPGRAEPPFWVWNTAMRQLYLSAYHLSPANLAAYVEAMKSHKVVYMLGYPSAMYELAVGILESGIEAPSLKVIVSNAEPLLPHQREALESAFRCPVRDTYGMAEMVVAAGECEYGQMHLWPEAGLVEVLDEDDNPLPVGEVGRLVCTGLINETMPLIRYDTGDRGALAPEGGDCPCGRNLPVLAEIEGRLDDVVVGPDGRRVGRLDTVFKADLPIRGAQIIQDSTGDLTVRVVWESIPDQKAANEIMARLRERVGPVEIVMESVERIPRGPGGKVRGVISFVSQRRSS